LRLPYVVSIDFWQYQVEVEVEVQLQYLCIHPKLQVNTDYIRQAPVMNSDNLRLIKEDEVKLYAPFNLNVEAES